MPRRAKILQRTIVVTFVGVTLFGVGFLTQSSIPVLTVVLGLVIDLALGLSLWALHHGMMRLSGVMYAITAWLGITFVVVYVHGTQTSPTAGMYVVMTVLCALILGSRAGYLFGGISLLTTLMVLVLEGYGLLPHPMVHLTPSLRSLWFLMVIASATTLVDAIVRVIDHALKESAQRAAELTVKNRELEAIRHSLEDRVAERTHEILREKQFFETLFRNSPVAIVILDMHGRVTSTNPAFERLFGYSEAEVSGQILDAFVADPTTPQDAYRNTQRLLHGETIFQQGRRLHRDGRPLWVEIRGVPVMDGGTQTGLLAIYYDLTEQRRGQEELRASEEKYRALFENMRDGVYRSTTDGRFLTANPALVSMLGYDSIEELTAQNIRDHIYANPQDRDDLLEQQHRAGETRNVELCLRRKDGKSIVVLENSFVVRNADGGVAYYEGTLTDITERKVSEQRLRFLATHDSLTGLPNRASFFEKLNDLIRSHESAPPRGTRPLGLVTGTHGSIAVMFLDLDGFKEVNDRFGHARGDSLLRRVAELLQAALRPGDMVARLGGDEFAFCFDAVDGPTHAALLARRVQEVLSAPVRVMEMEVEITSSIGISLYPTDGADAEILLKRADTAMYRVKGAGKNNFSLFQNMMV